MVLFFNPVEQRVNTHPELCLRARRHSASPAARTQWTNGAGDLCAFIPGVAADIDAVFVAVITPIGRAAMPSCSQTCSAGFTSGDPGGTLNNDRLGNCDRLQSPTSKLAQGEPLWQ